MKGLFIPFGVFLVWVVFMYFIIAFSSSGINFTNWSHEVRALCVAWGLVIGFLCYIMLFVSRNNKNEADK